MKDLSFFLRKNSLAAKMRKGIRSFCNGIGSTTTLDQRKAERDVSCMAAAPSVAGSSSFLDESVINPAAAAPSPLTLEQMILQLDMEEAAARRAKVDDDDVDDEAYGELHHRRMSCVHSSDILSSARKALSQYPRFSLDGRDAMYRSSFLSAGRRSVRHPGGLRGSPFVEEYYQRRASLAGLPATVAGERVVWCKPGVVAQLMGLEAVPVPLGGRHGKSRHSVSAMARKQSLRRMGRHELERERVAMGVHGQYCRGGARRESVGSCSGGGGAGDYSLAQPACARPSWGRPDRRFARVH